MYTIFESREYQISNSNTDIISHATEKQLVSRHYSFLINITIIILKSTLLLTLLEAY